MLCLLLRPFRHLAAFALTAILVSPGLCLAAPNLVANGDFSRVEQGVPVAWEACGNPQSVDQRLEAGDDNGTRFAQLVCTRCVKTDPSAHAMLAQVGKVHLEKGKLYTFSCRVKAENFASRIIAVGISDTRDWENCGLSAEIPLTSDWTTFSFRFKASRTVRDNSRLQFWHHDTGIFCLAEVNIVEAPEVSVIFTDLLPPGDSQNLLPNASFECGASGWSSLGRETGWGNLAGLHGHVITVDDAPHGHQILRIPLGGDHTPSLFFDYLKPVVRKETQPLAANIGWIPVKVGRPYTLSCFMRASADGVPAVLGLRLSDPNGSRWDRNDDRRTVTLSRKWQRFTQTFKPHKPCVFVTVGPALDTDRTVEVDLDAVQFEAGEQAGAFVPRSATEVGIEPSLFAPAGVFVAGQEPSLLFQSASDTGRRASIGFDVTDYFGENVALPEATANGWVQLPAEWKGYYRVRVTCAADSHMNGRSFPIAIVPRPACADTVVGINHAFAHAPLIRLAKKAGVTWYRDWSLKWQDLEPQPGEFHWEIGDVQIERVLAERVNLMALLPPFPSAEWNSEAPESFPKTGYPGVRLRQAWAPKDPAELGRFVGQAVSHANGRVKVWEFLNEPVYTDYALPGRDTPEYRKHGAKRYTVTDYVSLLTLAYAAMKNADPTCQVIGGIAGWPDHDALEAITKGCLDACDIFNLHIYPGKHPPEAFIPKMHALVDAMDASGKRKPIWMTEFSYYGTDTYPREPFIPDATHWAEERLLKDEKQCADYTVRFFVVMMSFGVEKIFIHSGANGAVNTAQFECCLFDHGGAPKKVFAALAVFTDLMGAHAKPAGAKRLGASGYSYAFETEKGPLTILWDADERASTTVPIPKGVTCLDLMGRPVRNSQVALGPSPVYFIKQK